MPDYKTLPTAVLNTNLDDRIHAYLAERSSEREAALTAAFMEVPELLLVAPKIAFRVREYNHTLPALIQILGPAYARDLLERGDTTFLHWKYRFMTLEKAESPPEGYNPFLYMAWGNPFTDTPEIVNERAINSIAGLSLADQRALLDLANRHSAVVDPGSTHEAWSIVLEAIAQGNLHSQGITPNEPLSVLSEEKKQYVARLMSDIAEANVMVERDLNLYESPDTWNAMLQVTHEVRSASQVLKTVEQIFEIERLPAVPKLVAAGALDAAKILELRHSQEAHDFRNWLWTRPDPADSAGTIAAYTSLVQRACRVDLSQGWLRAARVLGVSVAGFAAGSGIEALLGVPGSALSTTANIATGATISYLDQLVERMQNRSPLRFSARLRNELVGR